MQRDGRETDLSPKIHGSIDSDLECTIFFNRKRDRHLTPNKEERLLIFSN
jgi:hypothetical protein